MFLKIQFTEIMKWWLLLAIMLFIMYSSMMWKWGHQGDMLFWLNWSNYIFKNGFTNIYNSGCNYQPAYLYFLYLHTKIQGNLTDIQDNLYTLKYYTLIFDFLAAFFAVWFVKVEIKKVFYFFFLMFNVAFLYNTAFWAQVDSIYTCFGLIAIVAAIERKIIWSCIAIGIALNFKLQALVFIPIVGLILLPQILSKDGLTKFVIGLFLAAGISILILMPFLLQGKIHQVFSVISHSVDFYPFPTLGAFNIWSIFLPNVSIDGMYQLTDETKFMFLTYKQIGFFLFFSAVFSTLFSYLIFLKKKLLDKISIEYETKNIFLMASLVSINFYFLNTQMHERYVHPAIVLMATYSFLSKRYVPFILLSIAYFLNLERICWYLNLHHDTYMNGFIFKPRLIAGIYLITILWSYYNLYFDKTKIEN
ncbi:MAG TPA: hypothetical protein PLJ42_07355 [Chitinophagales bacterium]|jgi:Gpi18-like mannosyltransferase|nr:hypothetical protein [Chitinophagales bacterium]HQV78871.1 hypothetical protein [Chitinophagales bacterium]HQW79237.1 hypothetical protein [Chitinophagales bacterium]HRB66212.1 hypothetical protein [Chitinophagales bacterium]HRB92347.1 hypothetical protein [Chitinophagales bacterium]